MAIKTKSKLCIVDIAENFSIDAIYIKWLKEDNFLAVPVSQAMDTDGDDGLVIDYLEALNHETLDVVPLLKNRVCHRIATSRDSTWEVINSSNLCCIIAPSDLSLIIWHTLDFWFLVGPKRTIEQAMQCSIEDLYSRFTKCNFNFRANPPVPIEYIVKYIEHNDQVLEIHEPTGRNPNLTRALAAIDRSVFIEEETTADTIMMINNIKRCITEDTQSQLRYLKQHLFLAIPLWGQWRPATESRGPIPRRRAGKIENLFFCPLASDVILRTKNDDYSNEAALDKLGWRCLIITPERHLIVYQTEFFFATFERVSNNDYFNANTLEDFIKSFLHHAKARMSEDTYKTIEELAQMYVKHNTELFHSMSQLKISSPR